MARRGAVIGVASVAAIDQVVVAVVVAAVVGPVAIVAGRGGGRTLVGQGEVERRRYQSCRWRGRGGKLVGLHGQVDGRVGDESAGGVVRVHRPVADDADARPGRLYRE